MNTVKSLYNDLEGIEICGHCMEVTTVSEGRHIEVSLYSEIRYVNRPCLISVDRVDALASRWRV